MELESLTISKYRSIIKKTQIDLDGLTVLLGPNNQGKSNILQAIRLGMETLALAKSRLDFNAESGMPEMKHLPRQRYGFIRSRFALQSDLRYDWSRDFPAQLRKNGRVKPVSELRFNFSLSEHERKSFKLATTKSNNGRLVVEIKFYQDNIEIDFPKPGGSSSYRKSGREICNFIGEHFTFLYVPAIRTAEQAFEAISELIADRLAGLAKDDEYKTLVSKLDTLHQAHAEELSRSIGARLDIYMQGQSDLSIQMQSGSIRVGGLRAIENIELDDGVPTSILEKGDGVKSLLTMALLHDLADRGTNSQVLLAIDEPEAHLHPDAIHKMAHVLREIAAEQRVIVATHSPVIANRAHLEKNLIVENNIVKKVHKIDQIRTCLGVRPFDNMSSAEFLILTEGPTDRQIITAAINHFSPLCAQALITSRLAVTDTTGADNLPNRTRFALEMMSDVMVIVDDDSAGNGVVSKLNNLTALDRNRVRLLSIQGRGQSVLEDLYVHSLHEKVYFQHTNSNLPAPSLVDRGKTWSDRMKTLFRASGRQSENIDLDPLKRDLADQASQNIGEMLTPDALVLLKGIVSAIELMIIERDGATV